VTTTTWWLIGTPPSHPVVPASLPIYCHIEGKRIRIDRWEGGGGGGGGEISIYSRSRSDSDGGY